MSKYIKLYDAIMAMDEWFCEPITPTKILSDLPTIEVSEDCISREGLLKHAYKREGVLSVSVDSIKLAPSVVPTQTNAIQHTQSVESVESVEPTTEQSTMVGEWIDYYYPHFEVAGIECSVCGEDIPYWDRHYKEPRFCPNCGSRMKG